MTGVERSTLSRVASGALTATLVLSLLLSIPASLILLLFAFNTINPMTLMFATSFELQNESSESVRVWLAGTGEGGDLDLLPLYAVERPAIPAFRNGGFTISPGRKHRVRYDWDDHNFNVILVEKQNGELLALPVDTDDPKPGCCWQHRKDLYVIPPLQNLRRASAEERQLLNDRSSQWWILACAAVVPAISAFLYFLRRRTVSHRSQTAA